MAQWKYQGGLRMVVLDWAGTTVDHGCFAPLAPFIESLRRHGVEISASEARGPMGLHKRDHLRALLAQPAIASRWRTAHGKLPDEADVDRIFTTDFTPLQLACVHEHSRLIPGLLEVVAWLRAREIKVVTTTGYFQEAAQLCYTAAREQGYVPDAMLCASEVPQGRPAPWMVFRHMESQGVFPPAAVLKLGDTVPDIAEGRNAGVWSAGVARTGSEVGLTLADWEALPAAEKTHRWHAARGTLSEAGAHEVIESIADLPDLVMRLEDRLLCGEQP